MQPVIATSGTAVTYGADGLERPCISATFETIYQYTGTQQNVLWNLRLAVHTSDTTTAAELQALDLATGTPLMRFGALPWLPAHPVGSTAVVVHEPAGGLLLPGAWGSEPKLGVQARRTAGIGTVTVSVTKSIGG